MTDVLVGLREQAAAQQAVTNATMTWAPTVPVAVAAGVLLPAPKVIPIPASGSTTVTGVEPCDGTDGWAWNVVITEDSVIRLARTVLVPDSPSVVNFATDCPEVDPATLTVATPAVWAAVADSAAAAQAAAEDAADRAEAASSVINVRVLTESLQDAVDRTAASGDGELILPAGDTIISTTVTIPRGTVRLRGQGQKVTRVTAAAQQLIKFTGGNQTTDWGAHLRDITFDKVGVEVGGTIASGDAGNGFTIDNVEIANATLGLMVGRFTWGMRLNNSRIHNCTTGIKADGCGANNVYSNDMIFNNTTGFWQDGVAPDGSDNVFIGTDIENNGVGVYATSISVGTFHFTDCHFELNQVTNLRADSGQFFFDGFWMYPLRDLGTRVAAFDLSGTAFVRLKAGRLAWDANYLFKMLGTSQLKIDPEFVHTLSMGAATTAIFGTPATADSTAGFKVPKGMVAEAQLATDTAITRHATNTTQVMFVQPFNTNLWEYRTHIDFSAAEASSTLYVRFGPSATGGDVSFAIPATATSCDLVARMGTTRGLASVVFNTGATAHGAVALTHPVSASRFVSLRTWGGAAATATANDMLITAIG